MFFFILKELKGFVVVLYVHFIYFLFSPIGVSWFLEPTQPLTGEVLSSSPVHSLVFHADYPNAPNL